ncbi:MAG: response regulator [Bellilinea sp.]
MTHVVLIEDDPSMRHLLKLFLEMEQFKTTLIDHFEPNVVISELQSSQADFLLMDVHLNGANGLELLASVREQQGLKDLKILMTSGEDCEDACLAAGANGFLLKPYAPTDLLNWLRSKDSSLSN